ncbi:hypothetical protein SNOD_08110 [Streptomyces nodosus]|uniref:Uncharacterized protein n=1 Tax=Streptomyces nodosus TaxID=40318 RepID=A0A0B5D8Y9_9ACTN|nr:hypothetical protein SNOD_08110 [Streptomyces nodosus]
MKSGQRPGPDQVPERGPEHDPREVPESDAEYDPSAPAPLEVARTPTGNPDVDARLERLADADHLTTDGHPEVYEDVHQGLRDALTALDSRPGPPAPAFPRPPSGGAPAPAGTPR